MLSAPSLLTILKYGFLTMVVSSAGYLMGNVIVLKHRKADLPDNLVYKPRISRSAESVQTLLDRDFAKCLTHPTVPFCRMSGNRRLQVLKRRAPDFSNNENSQRLQTNHETTPTPTGAHPIGDLLRLSSQWLASFHVKPVLLDPSMLFCILSPSNKYALLERAFNPTDRMGSRSVITVGVSEKEATILDQMDGSAVLEEAGIAVTTVRRFLHREGEAPVRFLLSRDNVTLQVLVLFERGTFIWYPAITAEEGKLPDQLYTSAGAYENFTGMPLKLGNAEGMDIFVPNDPLRFLLQMKDSEFVTCPNRSGPVPRKTHPFLTDDQMQRRAVVAIQEMKSILQSYFAKFWLWSQSLDGWLEECNIFGRTHELNFAILNSAASDLNLTTVFGSNEYLQLLDHYGMEDKDAIIRLDCFGLRLNLFLCDEDGDSIGCYVDMQQTEKVVQKKFRLCSTEALGEKIPVPCQAELVVQTEKQLF